MRRMLVMLAALPIAAVSLHAQGVEIGASIGSFSLREQTSQNRSVGAAVGVAADWQRGRFGVRVDLARASLTPDDTSRAAFTAVLFDGRLSYRVGSSLGVELGFSRRTVSPKFATVDVGAVSIGIRSDARLGASAGLWARGALLPLVRFNGGGSTGASIEVALGTWLMFLHDRARAELDFSLQRIDRSVQGVVQPLQTGFTRLGVMFRI